MPPRKNPAGRWEQQKRSPPNGHGRRRRLYVVCPPEHNSPAFCRELMRQAIDRHVRGLGRSSITFGAFARDRFLPEYPASRNLKPSSRALLTYLLDKVIIPELGACPLADVDAARVARLVGKLQDVRKAPPTVKARIRGPLAPSTVMVAVKIFRRMLRSSSDFPRRTEIVDAARAYLDGARARLTAGSFAIYSQMLCLHILPRVARVRLGDADEAFVSRLAERLASHEPPAVASPAAASDDARGRRYSDQTIRHVVMTIKAVLGWAAQTEAIAHAPAIALPKVGEARRPQPYTREEARALIAAAADDEERALFLLAFDVGLRKSEILGLEWSQIIFEHNLMIIDRQRYRGRESDTKSGREREVPMTTVAEVALRKIRHLRFGDTPGRRWVFADENGQPRQEHWIRGAFERARRKAGLRKVRWHDHRHTFSTLRTDEKVPPFVLQKLLGHADIRTTQKYVHASADRLESVLDDPAPTTGRAS